MSGCGTPHNLSSQKRLFGGAAAPLATPASRAGHQGKQYWPGSLCLDREVDADSAGEQLVMDYLCGSHAKQLPGMALSATALPACYNPAHRQSLTVQAYTMNTLESV